MLVVLLDDQDQLRTHRVVLSLCRYRAHRHPPPLSAGSGSRAPDAVSGQRCPAGRCTGETFAARRQLLVGRQVLAGDPRRPARDCKAARADHRLPSDARGHRRCRRGAGRSAVLTARDAAPLARGRVACGRSFRDALEQLAVGNEHADQRPPQLVGDRRDRELRRAGEQRREPGARLRRAERHESQIGAVRSGWGLRGRGCAWSLSFVVCDLGCARGLTARAAGSADERAIGVAVLSARTRGADGSSDVRRRVGSLGAAERGAREAGDDRVGDACGQREIRIAPGPRELRAASRLIAHSARRATAPTSTIRRSPTPARAARARRPMAWLRGARVLRARPRRTRARPLVRSASAPPRAPHRPPAGDAPGTRRCRARAAAALARSSGWRRLSRHARFPPVCPVDELACDCAAARAPLRDRGRVDRGHCRCPAGRVGHVRGGGDPVVALQRLGHDPVKRDVDLAPAPHAGSPIAPVAAR